MRTTEHHQQRKRFNDQDRPDDSVNLQVGAKWEHRFGGADVFLDYYAAKSKLLRYSNGLFAPKDIFILFSLYQYR